MSADRGLVGVHKVSQNQHLRRSATEAQLGLEFEVELRCTEVPRSRVRAGHLELPRSPICQVRVRVRIFVRVRVTEFRFEIESEFRFHLFSCTAQVGARTLKNAFRMSSDTPRKCSRRDSGNPSKRTPGGTRFEHFGSSSLRWAHM